MNENTKDKTRITEIRRFYEQQGRMPSYSEIGEMLGLKSKNAVFKLVGRLEKENVLRRDEKGRLIPLSLKNATRILGTVEAGWPSPAEEELADTISLEAGILPGDMVLVDKGAVPKSGDIVIAEVDGEWTMKYLKKRGESVSLVPANENYKPIKPKKELRDEIPQ